jgi:alanyl-tRNA synthetase
LTGDELRQAFLSFFQERGHKVIPSSSLVPHKDPTLLLTSAGMVQIKPYFLGLETPPSYRLTSCQKCFRTTDIDSVGDSKHLTFFEMLGNFSVGDYFKEETISWAWEFVTKYLKLPEERLWITIYLDDEESFGYWRRLGVPADRILRFGDEDNFWGPVGNSGPCGPCSEIHYDLGEQFGCGKAECKPNCDCGRFSEIWNLVFTQYNQDPDGRRSPLPKPNIDTGMGLERTLAAVQGKSSPYETDLFSPLVSRMCSLAGKEYGRDENINRAIRIVAEHSRGIAFLIADGVIPSNESRGYVLRRILRRASLFGRKLGLSDPSLDEMTHLVIGAMSHVYPELMASESLITEVTRLEEEKFIATLDTGLSLMERLIREASSQVRKKLTGEEVFRLYDTYGFPPELSAEIVKEKGLSIDWEGFQAEMKRQRERGRAAHKVDVAVGLKVGASVVHRRTPGSTRFVGYSTLRHRSTVVVLLPEGKWSENQLDSVSQGQTTGVVLRETPFYGEMGGQVGDAGEISGERGRILVTDTVRHSVKGKELVIHLGKVIEGQISVNDAVEAEVDQKRRLDIARNHTATHLLQAALRQTLGSRVYQKGSLVGVERFRFDFSHLTLVTEGELTEIRRQVNEWIRQNLAVKARRLPYADAVAEGAIALFEEKYGEEVRMLTIGEPAISRELCGGTHVKSTGELGIFLITSESSIGTGLHRIEAITGRKAESVIESRSAALQRIAGEVESSLEDVPDKVKILIDELEAERKKGLSLERELSRKIVKDLPAQAEHVSGVTVLAARVPALTVPILREMGDILRDRLTSAVIVLATVYNEKPSFLAMVTPDLVARGVHAGGIIDEVAKITGGGGGGKAGMAQAGGKDASKVDEALKLAKSIVASQISLSSEGRN